MVLIPIGLTEAQVRRQPGVSYGIIVLTGAVSLILYLLSLGSDVPVRVEARTQEATRYYLQRPHLEIPTTLRFYVDEPTRRLLEDAHASQPGRAEGLPGSQRRRQQRTLNALADNIEATARESPLVRYGFVSADPDPLAAVRPIPGISWLHLVLNLLFLYVTAPFLEDVYGRLLFALLYIVSGVAGVFAQTWGEPGSASLLGAASAAAAGVMGAFVVRLGTSKIRFLWLPIPLLPHLQYRFFVPAFICLPLWLITQLWLLGHTSPLVGADLFALVGGFGTGAAFALLITVTGFERRVIHPAIESLVSWKPHKYLVRAVQAEMHGDIAIARRATGQVLIEEPKNLDAWRYAYEVSHQAKDWEGVAAAATWLLETYIQRGERELAKALIEEAPGHAAKELPARFYLRAGAFLETEKLWRSALDCYEAVVRRYWTDTAALRALIRCAEIEQGLGDPQAARRALTRASSHPECHGQWKEAVEKGFRELNKVILLRAANARVPPWSRVS